MDVTKNVNLEKLIKDCSSKQESAAWNKGWRELNDRYKKHILSIIRRKCYKFKLLYNSQDINQISKDIYQHVLIKLSNNNARILRKFKNTHDEKSFLAYLTTISLSTTSKFLQRYRYTEKKIEVDENIMMNQNSFDDDLWYIYEDVVETVRQNSSKQERTTEWALLMFNLIMFGDHDVDILQHNPIFSSVSRSKRDNIVNRIRQKLQK